MARQGERLSAAMVRMPINCPRHSPCIDLAYTDVGDGEPLVLIHSIGATGWSWRRQIEDLSRSYRVVAMDLRGHGDSGRRPDEAASMRVLAGDVIGLARGLGLTQAHFCGNSLGGMIAMEIWVRAPDLMKSLVLADTTAFFPPPQVLEEFLQLFDRMEMAAWGRFMAARLLRREAPADLVEEVATEIAATDREAYRQGLTAAFQADYRWALPVMDIPALILVGADDQATPRGYSRYLQSRIRGAGLAVVEQAAHLPHRENPRAFNRHLQEHLASL